MPSTFTIYCEWFQQTYNRPLTCNEVEFLAAIAAQPPTTPAESGHPPRYLDGEEDREGWYR